MTEEKPFSYEVCEKEFAAANELKLHERIHEKKPYKCTICVKDLEAIDSSDKQFKCPGCNKIFSVVEKENVNDEFNSQHATRNVITKE